MMPKGKLTLAGLLAGLALILPRAPLYAGDPPRFEEFAVPLYDGTVHPPKWIQHQERWWTDELGKRVEAPVINFAGKYFLAAHSCGSGCRYYTMTDLSTGRESRLLEGFATAEPAPKTRDGREYLTILFSRSGSRMLIAQYHIDFGKEKEECRERVFLLEKNRLKPITGTRRGCGELESDPGL
jgi:hypothetical protein